MINLFPFVFVWCEHSNPSPDSTVNHEKLSIIIICHKGTSKTIYRGTWTTFASTKATNYAITPLFLFDLSLFFLLLKILLLIKKMQCHKWLQVYNHQLTIQFVQWFGMCSFKLAYTYTVEGTNPPHDIPLVPSLCSSVPLLINRHFGSFPF